MQVLSAYLIESNDLTHDELSKLISDLSGVVLNWLAQKGVVEPSSASGEFNSRTEGAVGKFTRKVTTTEDGVLEEILLQEPSRTGQTFFTSIALISLPSRLVIYGTLTVRNARTVIAPILTDPRCPSVIRDILRLQSGWMFGGERLPDPVSHTVSGNEGARALANVLCKEDRALPIVVVSEIDGQTVWEGLAEKLAIDLAGLAKVYSVDEEASWTLTDEIGKILRVRCSSIILAETG